MNPLVRRQKAVSATQEWVRGKRFTLGSVDCMKMVGFHLKQFGKKVPWSKGGPYRTPLQARAALRRAGHETVMDVVDSLGLERITPASALMGDIVSFPSDETFGALGIVIGNGNMLAFHEAHDLPVIMAMDGVDMAWRVL